MHRKEYNPIQQLAQVRRIEAQNRNYYRGTFHDRSVLPAAQDSQFLFEHLANQPGITDSTRRLEFLNFLIVASALSAAVLTSAPIASAEQENIPQAPASAQQMGEIVVPLYQYPYWYNPPRYNWPSVAAEAPSTNISAVINPDNGPGIDFPNIDYTHGLTDLHPDVETQGYNRTNYGNRPLADIIADIDVWMTSVYTPTDGGPVQPAITDGLFLDEVASDPAHLQLYSDIVQHVRATYPGTRIVLNPGVVPDEAYFLLGTDVVMFENSLEEWDRQKDGFPPFLSKYSNQTIAMVHSTSPDSNVMCRVIDEMNARGIYKVYVTDDQFVQDQEIPYDDKPSYWEDEAKKVRGDFVPRCAPYHLYLPSIHR